MFWWCPRTYVNIYVLKLLNASGLKWNFFSAALENSWYLNRKAPRLFKIWPVAAMNNNNYFPPKRLACMAGVQRGEEPKLVSGRRNACQAGRLKNCRDVYLHTYFFEQFLVCIHPRNTTTAFVLCEEAITRRISLCLPREQSKLKFILSSL